jgi:hypothetical protein
MTLLATLNISRNHFTGSSLSHMFSNQTVRSLDISSCENLASSLDALHGFPITHLYISSSKLLPSTMAKLLSSLVNLQHLEASDNFIDTSVVFALSPLPLTYLNMSYGTAMTQETISSLFLVLVKITSLNTLCLNGHVFDDEFTMFCFVALLRGQDSLGMVWMDGNRGVDAGELAERAGEGGNGKIVVMKGRYGNDRTKKGGAGQLVVYST